MRIVEISDLHLSRLHSYFYYNWTVVLDALNADPPDLVVVNGDVSFNGADSRGDLEFARNELQKISVPVFILPGNHDIGDDPESKKLDQPVNRERLKRWREIFGSDRFSLESGGYQILGINTALFGSGLIEEKEQWDWLSRILTGNPIPALLFMHKPLFTLSPEETSFNKSCIDPVSRKRFWFLLEQSSVETVSSAHVHVYKNEIYRETEFLWCPPVSFVVTWEGKDVYGGIRRAGYLEFILPDEPGESKIFHNWMEPEQLVNYDLRNWFKSNGSTVKLPPLPLY
ncbi:MAG: metallophosphoesterase family protein [Spirochaetia bacterium]